MGSNWLRLLAALGAYTLLASSSCYVAYSSGRRIPCDPSHPNYPYCSRGQADGEEGCAPCRWRIRSYRWLGPTALEVLEGPRDTDADPVSFGLHLFAANPALLGPDDVALEGAWTTDGGTRVSWLQATAPGAARVTFALAPDGTLVGVERVPLAAAGGS
jgi:hypothetical protein